MSLSPLVLELPIHILLIYQWIENYLSYDGMNPTHVPPSPRTEDPFPALSQGGCGESTSRCLTEGWMRSPTRDQPVIPRVIIFFNRKKL